MEIKIFTPFTIFIFVSIWIIKSVICILGNVSKIEMPQMYKLSVQTAITCLDGQYNLIAALSPKDQDGVTDLTRKVMVFVKCDVQIVKEVGE